MKLISKVLIIIFIFAVLISGAFFGNYIFEGLSPTQTASSVVNIENGVSGVVTVKDPFLNKTVDINIDYEPLDVGSGVIVTNDGYILTAFHVVSDPQTITTQGELKKMEDSDVKRYVEQAAVTNYISNYNPQLGNELANNNSIPSFRLRRNPSLITDILVNENLLNAKSYKQIIKVNLPPSNGVNALNSHNARLVDFGDPASDKDVALLKIDPFTNKLPFLNISAQKPNIGENVQIYGYPSSEMHLTTLLNPSSSTGSLISEMPNQVTVYYETTASVAPGDSGGPVLNPQNNVIGIVIYGVGSRRQFRQTIGQSSLFLSSDYMIQLCEKNKVPIHLT